MRLYFADGLRQKDLVSLLLYNVPRRMNHVAENAIAASCSQPLVSEGNCTIKTLFY